MKRIALGLVLAAVTATQSGVAQDAGAKPVFQIGVFDRSSAEFHGSSEMIPTFKVGTSDPQKDWYANQKTDAQTADAGPSAMPRVVEFPIDGTPLPFYRMHLAVLLEHFSIPAVEISVNGKVGRFYPEPVLDMELGDMVAATDPTYAHADVVFTFPGSFLHAGVNTVTFRAVEEGDPAVLGGSFTYDAVQLDGLSKAPVEDKPISVTPTVFYIQHEGALQEIVDVVFPKVVGGPVTLAIAGKTYEVAALDGMNFGERKLSFTVNEFAPGSGAFVTWSEGTRQRHFDAKISPAKKWTLSLVPHTHLDIGFTNTQADIAAVQSRLVDKAMDLTEQHPEFRFSMDASWSLDQFMKTRSTAEQERAIAAMKARTLFVPPQQSLLESGFPTAETLIRSLYGGANFSREHGTPFDYVNITDVPSYSWSYASVLASAGIKYFAAASNNHRAPVLTQGLLHEQSPFYWEGPDGKKVFMWYTRHYSQSRSIFGLPLRVANGREMISLFLQNYDHPGYLSDHVIIYGTQLENTDLDPSAAEIVSKWNSVYAFPKLEYSGFVDAMKTIEKQFDGKIPTVRGDGGPYWDLGIGANAAGAALERETEARAPSAEKLATIGTLVDPRLAVDKKALDRMWEAMVMMDEHTWASENSATDANGDEPREEIRFKNQLSADSSGGALFMLHNSMASLSESISTGREGFIVFNTLNWTRDGEVRMDIDKGTEIVDRATGKTVPFEVLNTTLHWNHVRFTAEQVPGVGYKVFDVRKTTAVAAAESPASGNVMENRFYRVTFDPETGSVRSIFDKELARELVDAGSPYHFGQYLYVTGGDRKPNGERAQSWYRPTPQLTVTKAAGGKLVSVQKTMDGWVARLESTALNTPKIGLEVRLFDAEKKIEFVEDVTKDSVTTDESVYFAFPFAEAKPAQFQYEIQTGVVDPAKDMYPGAGKEWFPVQHWAAAGSGVVMPLDASLMTFGDINRDAYPRTFGERPGTIFSYVMNNYWEDNFAVAQGGTFRFRYLVTSVAKVDRVALSRKGWEEMTPLEVQHVKRAETYTDHPRTLTGDAGSFLKVEDEALLLDTWKPAEDGRGTVLRFLELGGKARTVKVEFPLGGVGEAWLTDAVERDQTKASLEGNSVILNVEPHAIVTLRVLSKK